MITAAQLCCHKKGLKGYDILNDILKLHIHSPPVYTLHYIHVGGVSSCRTGIEFQNPVLNKPEAPSVPLA